ncbi:hypothetical protein HPP92_020391 [Vanilla planifolia]|uniref:HMG box domain-containing protein n=1 Tax=Vanilla planifolia TaxID=51239 RepID=A0A835PWZ4_VANPL|nr:hypothetical protein HPP92_020391 [Vanilla planifolia]
MAGGSSKANPPRHRRRVAVETEMEMETETGTMLKRAKDGSAFTKCEACKRDVPVGLIDMHDCSLDSKIKMNLQAQVEKVSEIKKPERKIAAPSLQSGKNTKKEKKSGESKKGKRPTTAFFLFMDDFRKEFKEANPDNKNVALVAKEGGAKWKAMTDMERKVYQDRVAELKQAYEKAEEEDGKGVGSEA